MAKWFFKKQRPGDTTREPIQGEFFSTEAINNTAEALVREGIQNSLDAGRDGAKVRVRICLLANQKAAPNDMVQPYLDGLWPHLQARQNGLQNVPVPTVPCPVLIFEDFGTTGLGGDPHQWHKIEGTKNGFFTFFRAEGQSDKEKGDRGRWGVGKFVFPRSSQISTFWGITTRHQDGKQLLMGRSILKSHAIDGVRYVPDGYFGKQVKVTEDGELIVPFDEKEVVEKFCQHFGLARGTEPGLSLMVPWYDPEITQNTLLRAVIEGYFFPILGNDLEVSVESSDGKIDLTASTLVSAVEKLNGNLASGMVPLINLAKWSKTVKPDDILQLNRMPETGAPNGILRCFPTHRPLLFGRSTTRARRFSSGFRFLSGRREKLSSGLTWMLCSSAMERKCGNDQCMSAKASLFRTSGRVTAGVFGRW